MRKRIRRLALLGIALATAAAGVLYEASTHVARGWLRGEAFFEGRPTSYWRSELEQWTARRVVDNNVITFGPPSISYWFSRKESLFEKYTKQWLPRIQAKEDVLFDVLDRMRGPRLLRCNDDVAILVLNELLVDPSPEIRRFAQIGLKLNVEED